MKRFASLAVIVGMLASLVSAQDVKLPTGPLEVRVKELLLIDVDGASAKASWLIFPPDAGCKLIREADPGKTVKLYFWAPTAGNYWLSFADANGSVKQYSLKIVAGETATPPKEAAVAKHLTFIGLTPESAPAINDQPLRAWLSSAGVSVHLLVAGDPYIKTGGLQKAVDAAGGLPCVVIQDAKGGVITQAKTTTAAAVKVLVTPYTGGK